MTLKRRRSIRGIISMILFAAILGMATPADTQGAEAKKAVLGDKKKPEEKAADAEDGTQADEEIKEDAAEEDKEVKEEVSEADGETEEDAEAGGEAEENLSEVYGESSDAADDGAIMVPVPIYNYDIANVVIPTSYSVALNPYELPIKTKDGTVSSAQVVSQNYGIVNKSTRDKVVTATFTIEDENAGKIVFVGTKEEALNADKDTFAVYLSVVPADDTGIKIDGSDADKDTSDEALSNVTMNKAEDHAIVLSEGESQISFKLSRAVYEFGGSEEIVLDSEENADEMPVLTGLAADSGGITAFTFDGVMNPKADWSKLTKGVRISVTYDYDNAVGDEKIVEGTGAIIEK